MKVKLASPSDKHLDVIVVSPSISIAKLKDAILASKVALRPTRQRLTIRGDGTTLHCSCMNYTISIDGKRSIVLDNDRLLDSYHLTDGDTIYVKDLGPQIGWQAVFVIEYLGPLIIHQLWFAYLGSANLGLTQKLAFSCITFHFLKREYETFFVHRFSHATMPVGNLFKNCAHYWILSGFVLAYYMYSSRFVSPGRLMVLLSAVVFLAAELANFYTHLILRSLRPANTSARAIPTGFGFDLVSCPNYFFESVAWVAFSCMTGLGASWIFTGISTLQMYMWALKKHSQYLREFPDYPRSRKIMFPLLV